MPSNDPERRARRLREELVEAERAIDEERTLFKSNLIKSEQAKRNAKEKAKRERQRQEARQRREDRISSSLSDATNEQLRAALQSDEEFSRLTNSQNVEALFGGRIFDFDHAREKAREAIRRELGRRRETEQQEPVTDGGVRTSIPIAGREVSPGVVLVLLLLAFIGTMGERAGERDR